MSGNVPDNRSHSMVNIHSTQSNCIRLAYGCAGVARR